MNHACLIWNIGLLSALPEEVRPNLRPLAENFFLAIANSYDEEEEESVTQLPTAD